MTWTDPGHLQAALLAALLAGALGWFVPRAIALVPEPEPEPALEQNAVVDAGVPAGAPKPPPSGLGEMPPKEPYSDIAALPGLAPRTALLSALVAAVLGATVGYGGSLLFLVPLAPVGVLLGLVDWRTALLPTKVIGPTYLALTVLIPLAALVDGEPTGLLRAAIGWVLVGGWFWVFWWVLGAWGFGDVRLARALGPVLGYLGPATAVSGLMLMVVLGGLGGVVLALVNRSLRRRFPYGPFMLVGALLGVPLAPYLLRGVG